MTTDFGRSTAAPAVRGPVPERGPRIGRLWLHQIPGDVDGGRAVLLIGKAKPSLHRPPTGVRTASGAGSPLLDEGEFDAEARRSGWA
jgi:hypothetical protein